MKNLNVNRKTVARFTALILMAMLLITLIPATALMSDDEPPYLSNIEYSIRYGDINGDGVINAADFELLRH